MIKPTKPLNESERLETLDSYQIINTPSEINFDKLTKLASDICQTPIALIGFIEADRQWIKSRIGIDVEEADRDVTFCAHVISQNKPLVIEDTFKDERFSDNPFVRSGPEIRFYTGLPIRGNSEHPLGTLCVLDREPRQLNEFQMNALQILANQVNQLMEQHRLNLELHQALNDVRAAQAAEKKARYLLSEACQLSKMGAWELDLTSQKMWWSDELYALYGMQKEQFSYEAYLAMYEPDVREKLQQAFEEGHHKHRDIDLEVPRNHPDGTTHWYKQKAQFRRDQDGQAVQLYGMAQDITEQKRLQILHDKTQYYHNCLHELGLEIHINQSELIQKSLEILSAFYDCPVDIKQKNTDEILTLASHPVSLGLSESTRQDLDAYFLRYYGHDQVFHLGQLDEPVLQTTLAEEGITHVMSECIWIKGEAYAVVSCYNHLHLNSNIYSDSDYMNIFCHWLGFMLERVEHIQNLQILNDKQNMILGIVAHDLRSPLATIQMANMQNQRLFKKDQAVNPTMLNIIEQACKSAASLIDELLEVAQNQESSFVMQSQKLTPVLDSILTAFAEKIKNKDLQLHWQNQAPAVYANIRSKKFIRAIENILHNAYKFTPNGGSISVTLSQQDNEVCIAIQDTGIGIPEHLKSLIFDKFTKARRKGTGNEESHGLGMFISHEIIAKHGGRIEVTSQEGQGTCFSIFLPLLKTE